MILRTFARKQLRRLRAVALPAALAAGLWLFAITQLPSANTLWSQQVTLSSSVSTGTWECQPYTLAVTSAATAANTTTFTYRLTGGGFVAQGENCKYAVASLALNNVCFNPLLNSTLGGDVLAETHPATTTNPASSWAYNPSNTAPKRVKWDASNVGTGPFTLQFSVTLAGTVPTVAGQFTLQAGTAATTGAIPVPDPASCHAPAARIASSAPSASPPIGSDPTPGDTLDSTTPAATDATPASTPTPITPTPTPTPKPRNPNPTPTPVGISVLPQ